MNKIDTKKIQQTPSHAHRLRKGKKLYDSTYNLTKQNKNNSCYKIWSNIRTHWKEWRKNDIFCAQNGTKILNIGLSIWGFIENKLLNK